MNAVHFALIFLTLGVLAACAAEQDNLPSQVSLSQVDFSSLPGWNVDAVGDALGPLQKSCDVWRQENPSAPLGFAGTAHDWIAVCASLPREGSNDGEVRRYFETLFQPYRVSGGSDQRGLFTGYYVPELSGSVQPTETFHTPLYARPTNLISVDLGLFKKDLRGEHIVGKVIGNTFVPYDPRADIVAGSLEAYASPLVWVDDPVGAFFLEVQGSGYVKLTDGTKLLLGYDGSNGKPYISLGRVLVDQGKIERPVTMPKIRAWLEAHPDQAKTVMDENPSYVFFRFLPNDEVLGAEGVGLTPGRSLAVDPAFVPLGVPLWLDTKDGRDNTLQRLVVAQDTGGAIKGIVRGDFFWGEGEEAAQQAGAMQSSGSYYVLLPKSVFVHD
jgi:membrane-bound lytic murein transglycosylase A